MAVGAEHEAALYYHTVPGMGAGADGRSVGLFIQEVNSHSESLFYKTLD